MLASRPATTPVFDQLLADVCDQGLAMETREVRFAALLETTGGPFADSHRPMIESVYALAKHVVASALRRQSLPGLYLDSRDVAHDAFTVFFENCHKISDPSQIRSWFWTVMGRRTNSLLKAQAHVEVSGIEVENVEAPSVSQDEICDAKADAEPSSAVADAIQALTPSLRDVAVLHVLHGYSHVESARTLGIKHGAARARWARANRILKSRLADDVRATC